MSRKGKKYKIPSQALAASSPPEPISVRRVRVSFEYTDIGCAHCLSRHGGDEIRAALRCLQKMTSMTWADVLKTAGGRPTGLHWSHYPDSVLRGVARPTRLSPDVKIVGVRASDRQRIFGVHVGDDFYVLWFDRSVDSHHVGTAA